MKTLNELNIEIERLLQQRQDLLNKERLQEEEKLKDLKWTKDYTARLEINPLSSAGLPKYTIMIYGKPPCAMPAICVMGEHKLYEYNIMYATRFGYGDDSSFYTSCPDMLIKFLNSVKFKKLEYNEEHLRVLKAAEHISTQWFCGKNS